MTARISLVTALLLLITSGCVPIEDDGSQDDVAQPQYDPAACGQTDLTADLSDPTYYWSFDSGLDADTGGAQATASGGLSTDGESLMFDGEDDYLTVDGVEKPESFTMSFFVQPNSLSEGDQRMLVNLGNGPNTWEGVGVNTREGSVRFFAEGDGGASEEITAATETLLPVDEWTHVLATKSGATLRIFLNGELAAERSDFTYDLNYGSNGLVFGRHSYFESKYFHGRIDEFAMWDFGFSGGEVATFTTNLASCE